MLYIEQIKMKEAYLTLQKDRLIELKPLTVIVGEQGCGKSTILRLLNKNSDKIEVKLCEYLKNNLSHTLFTNYKWKKSIDFINEQKLF